MQLRDRATQRPVLTAVGCAVVQFLLTVLILKAGFALVPAESFGKVKLLAFASTIVFPLLLVQGLGLWSQVGLQWSRVRPAPIFLISLLSAVLFLAMGVHRPDQASVAGDVLMQFVNAFGEELLFRGVIFTLLLGLPRGRAVLLGGVLFGAMHLIHGFMGGGWGEAASQALVTSIAGTMFVAVRYGTGSLWLTIVLHMVLNLSMMYSNVEPAAGATAMFVVERLANVFELLLAVYVVMKATTPAPVAAVRH